MGTPSEDAAAQTGLDLVLRLSSKTRDYVRVAVEVVLFGGLLECPVVFKVTSPWEQMERMEREWEDASETMMTQEGLLSGSELGLYLWEIIHGEHLELVVEEANRAAAQKLTGDSTAKLSSIASQRPAREVDLAAVQVSTLDQCIGLMQVVGHCRYKRHWEWKRDLGQATSARGMCRRAACGGLHTANDAAPRPTALELGKPREAGSGAGHPIILGF